MAKPTRQNTKASKKRQVVEEVSDHEDDHLDNIAIDMGSSDEEDNSNVESDNDDPVEAFPELTLSDDDDDEENDDDYDGEEEDEEEEPEDSDDYLDGDSLDEADLDDEPVKISYKR
jgi:hypothetical protein